MIPITESFFPLVRELTAMRMDSHMRMAASLSALCDNDICRTAEETTSRTYRIRHGFFAATQVVSGRLTQREAEPVLQLLESWDQRFPGDFAFDNSQLGIVSSGDCVHFDSVDNQFNSRCLLLTKQSLQQRTDGPDLDYICQALKIVKQLGYGEFFSLAVDSIIHLQYRDPSDSMTSYTLYPLTGTVFTDWTEHPLRYAEALVHEASHSFLNLVMQSRGINPSQAQKQFWSPWRHCLRPSVGIIHGAWAFAFVLDFYHRIVSKPELLQLSSAQQRYCENRVEFERDRLDEVRLSLPEAIEDLGNATVGELLCTALDGV